MSTCRMQRWELFGSAMVDSGPASVCRATLSVRSDFLDPGAGLIVSCYQSRIPEFQGYMNQQQFPILNRGIYANHAAISPWPRSVSDAVRAFAEENAERGPERYREWISRERELKDTLAGFIGAKGRQDIAFLKNTTEGISTVAFGYPFQDGDNIVLPRGEFSSNRLPWLAQQSRGVSVREVDIRVEDPERALSEAMDAKTRILSVSGVQFDDGFRLDLEHLGSVCKERGVLFFVDAIQQLGALPLDVASCHIDCLAADAHKWLLGPEGIAVFYCNERARGEITLRQLGWHMFDNPWSFDRSEWEPSGAASRFEAGSPNSIGQAALAASMGLILDESIEAISERVLANTAHLMSGLKAVPAIRVLSDQRVARRSGIVSIGFDGGEISGIYKRLRERSVTCALRRGAIRLSPHYYQDEAVMDRLLNAIEDAVKG